MPKREISKTADMADLSQEETVGVESAATSDRIRAAARNFVSGTRRT
jgi:hypothetical protein